MWRPLSTAVYVALIILVLSLQAVHLTAKSFTIHWNNSNPIFRLDNTNNVIDVNQGNLKFGYDQANLITNPNPRIIAVCDKPYKLVNFTITFRPFTPQPGGLEFLPGDDYYFSPQLTSAHTTSITHNQNICIKTIIKKCSYFLVTNC